MTKRVQIVGGDTAAANAFKGLEREIYVVTDTFELRIHDGVTPGGHRLLTQTTYDTLYQPLDATLTGFASAVITADKLAYGSGADAFAVTDFTSYGRQLVGSTDAADARLTLELSTTDDVVFATADVGDPGLEAAGINIGGVVYAHALRVNDIGLNTPVEMILHRHSTTIEPIFMGARSNSDDNTHAAVVADQGVLTFYGAGWTGAEYNIFTGIKHVASALGTSQ